MKPLTRILLTCWLSLSICSCQKDEPDVANDDLAISLDKTELTIEAGGSERLTASFSPSDAENTAHEWRTSDPEIATVDETGMVNAIAPGQANITAVAVANGATATCAVTVVDKIIYPTSVSFNTREEYVLVGETVKLEATVLPENSNSKSLTWSSTDNSVASVDNDGTVHGIAAGTAEISAATSNNKVAKCKITVGNKTVYFNDVTVDVVDDTSARYSFSVTPQGVTVSEVGICIDTDKTPTIESTSIKASGTTGNISGTLTKLTPNTIYFFRAYAKDNSNVYYSATTKFTTQGSIKTNFKVRKIYDTAIEISTPAIPDVKALNICYGPAPNPEITDFTVTAKYDSKEDVYTATLNNLDKGTTYYFRAFTQDGTKITYYSTEGHAETIGKTVKLSRNYINYSYEVSYFLPQGKTYYVEIRPGALSKTQPVSHDDENTLYLSGGTGKFYYWSSNGRTAFITVTDLDTGIVYDVPY